ncbi:MAG: HAD family hydrolase [Erysipelotrichaceae bacterium]
MIKLIACDMDGTLLNSHHNLSDANVLAIQSAIRSGIRFLIATGRDYDNVINILKKSDIHCGCILLNGAQYIDEQGILVEQIPLDSQQIEMIYNEFEKSHLYHEIICGNEVFSPQSIATLALDFRQRLRISGKISEQELDCLLFDNPFLNRIKKIESVQDLLKKDLTVLKMEAFKYRSEEIEIVRSVLKGNDNINVSSSFANNIEVTSLHASKGEMLEKVIARFGFVQNEIMVIGDSDNDISMANRFPNSVAMRNASAPLRKASTMITDSNDDDGVARIIFRTIEQNKKLKNFNY